jgi:hypothetical protein
MKGIWERKNEWIWGKMMIIRHPMNLGRKGMKGPRDSDKIQDMME